MSYTREQVQILFDILNKIEWFDKEEEFAPLSNLLFDDCKTDSERDLVIDLIKRTRYLKRDEFDKILDDFVKDITNKFESENTILVVTAIDSNIDSSQLILYEMKARFKKFGWDKIDGLSNLSKIGSKAFDPNNKNMLLKKNIIIVDEFIGSGKTMIDRIKYIEERFKEKKVTEGYKIYIYSIAGTEKGLYNLIDNSINYRCEIELSQGISDHYKDGDKEVKIVEMKYLESLLSDVDGDCKLEESSLGYGETETLYKRERGNSPNNVFPIFWWGYYKDYTKRETLMERMC